MLELEPGKRHCTKFGCPRRHYARGLCRSHYRQKYLKPSLSQAQQRYRQTEGGKETEKRYERLPQGKARQARYRQKQRDIRQQELEQKRQSEREWYEQRIREMPADRQAIFRELPELGDEANTLSTSDKIEPTAAAIPMQKVTLTSQHFPGISLPVPQLPGNPSVAGTAYFVSGQTVTVTEETAQAIQDWFAKFPAVVRQRWTVQIEPEGNG